MRRETYISKTLSNHEHNNWHLLGVYYTVPSEVNSSTKTLYSDSDTEGTGNQLESTQLLDSKARTHSQV